MARNMRDYIQVIYQARSPEDGRDMQGIKRGRNADDIGYGDSYEGRSPSGTTKGDSGMMR